ncbi:MAG: tRNA(Ile)-lysidine synthetase, partial [Hyphomicrobiales bacterium]
RVWDGRLRIAPQERAAGPFAIGPLGAARAKEAAPEAADAPASLVRAALAVEPALFEAGELVGPAAGTAAAARGVTAVPVVAPFCRFLPGFDLALAAALGRLVGAPALPAPPWKHHIIAAQA